MSGLPPHGIPLPDPSRPSSQRASPLAGPPACPPAGPPACAIIADDDAFFRLAVASLLTSQLGFDAVAEATDMGGALTLIGTSLNVTLVLLDLKMPGMDLAHSLDAARRAAPAAHVAVVSATESRSTILEALGAGAHGYVIKGSGPEDLCAALKTILAGQIHVPAQLADLDSASARDRVTTPLAGQMSLPGDLPSLTARQKDVLAGIARGQSNREIADHLSLGQGTVKIHVGAVLRVLGAPNRAAAAAMAVRSGLGEQRTAKPPAANTMRPSRRHRDQPNTDIN